MQETILFWVFVSLGLIGFYLAYLYGRRTTQFRWSEYLGMITLPILFILFLGFYFDVKVLYMFLISSIVGFIAEGLIGFVYDKVLDKRLWTYNRLDIKGYTSLLSIPLWGIAGIVFWFLSKLIGL